MFTGIVRTLGTITSLLSDKSNLIIGCASPISNTFKIDQSVAHNGICLTITKKTKTNHQVVAISETLKRTNLRFAKKGDIINLETSLKIGDTLDGHFVQGHIDECLKILSVKDLKGSHRFELKCSKESKIHIIPKGSICLNGISLTISSIRSKSFTVDIIPYTYAHTNLSHYKAGDFLNVEYDLLGKYIQQFASRGTGS